MGAASVLMGSGSSDAGITPLWVIPLTTQGPAGHLCLDRSTPSSLLPLSNSTLSPGPTCISSALGTQQPSTILPAPLAFTPETLDPPAS